MPDRRGENYYPLDGKKICTPENDDYLGKADNRPYPRGPHKTDMVKRPSGKKGY
jgi:hypothetical protein